MRTGRDAWVGSIGGEADGGLQALDVLRAQQTDADEIPIWCKICRTKFSYQAPRQSYSGEDQCTEKRHAWPEGR